MRRTFVGGRSAGVAVALVLFTLTAQAQTGPAGPTTTPSGSYLNLQPRRQVPQPPLVAPRVRPPANPAAGPRESRQVVCGLTVITPPTGIDDAMMRPVPAEGPRPTMRTIDPPVCRPSR